ncbi:hypothetical protein [Listeria booriae]|nr:hypothetical protein [Listeria booriae]MBC1804257.1 hypothetical protein [Listeria booriae]
MSKKIQLPSGRLSEHAKAIGSKASDISFNLQPTTYNLLCLIPQARRGN